MPSNHKPKLFTPIVEIACHNPWVHTLAYHTPFTVRMLTFFPFLLFSTASVAAALSTKRTVTAGMTPHDQYSSSIGVLGCKINTNRVAYWPGDVTCNDICVEVSNAGRSVTLLKIDTSAGAHDISYDAWNYLIYGKSAKESPRQGGAVEMQYQIVPADRCKHLLFNGKLPLSASNSMNYVTFCLQDKNSWVARNYELINIVDATCHWGWDETCSLNLSESNQPTCPNRLGEQHPLVGLAVTNIQYGTGEDVKA